MATVLDREKPPWSQTIRCFSWSCGVTFQITRSDVYKRLYSYKAECPECGKEHGVYGYTSIPNFRNLPERN